MPQVTWGTCQKVYEVLVPGSKYSTDKAAKLASIMRKFSDELLQQTQEIKRCQPDNKKSQRDVDFSKYQKRYVALDVSYQGFEYHGFARQDGIEKTIEEELLSALRKTRLIPNGTTWKELSYSRGGRTDKCVSAAGQVVALEVRSKALLDEDSISEEMEFDYPAILNKVLNREIRVLGWKTVEPSFSARFSAKSREYKYFFIEENCDLDVPAMQKAAQYLVGEHDFRNFCKADIPAVSNFVRNILSASLRRTGSLKVGNFTGVELHIEGTAFLWHQIRCIAAVLHTVGKGLEPPEIIRDLLDIQTNDRKPQYSMASPHPLLLNRCSYEGLCFNRSEKVASLVNREISMEISGLLSKVLLLLRMRDEVRNAPVVEHLRTIGSEKPHNYIPLLKRTREPSIEERLLRHQHLS